MLHAICLLEERCVGFLSYTAKYGCCKKIFVVMLETKAIQDLIEITGQQEHNLYIDTVKFLEGVWVEQEIISDNVFSKIFVNATVVPVRIGRIPYKIQSKLGHHYSFIALCSLDVLNESDLECWRHFVLAS